MAEPHAPVVVPAGATGEKDGIQVGAGPVRVDLFIDFMCPFCRRFELSAWPALERLLRDEAASLVYHPMNFLDGASTTNYSTRAAAASGCAADGQRFMQYAHALFIRQPAEGGAGLSDAELAAIAAEVGLGAGFSVCLDSGKYLDWPPYVTARAEVLGVSATPAVLVNGTQVAPETEALTSAVERALGS
jgi:protein-disulfide isomerase